MKTFFDIFILYSCTEFDQFLYTIGNFFLIFVNLSTGKSAGGNGVDKKDIKELLLSVKSVLSKIDKVFLFHG